MKTKVAWMLVVLLMFSVLVQTISLADSVAYSDVVAHQIASRNPDVTRDELVEQYGTPYSETETSIGYWDREQATYLQYFFVDGRLSYIYITYGKYAAEYWDRTYTMFDTTRKKISEILGEDWGTMYHYNDTGNAVQDLNSALGAWSGEGIGVLLVYSRSDDDLTVKAKLTFIP